MFNRFFTKSIRFAATTTIATTSIHNNINLNENESVSKAEPRVWKILFTGGPCGGKSTALSTAQQFLMNHGFIVYTIPEASTVLRLGGVTPSYHTLNPFQNVVTSLQTNFEDLYYYYAKNASIIHQKNVIILIDRGIMDGKCYVNDNEFCNVLQFAQHENINATDPNYDEIFNRYDLILHLVSASKGAPEFYKQEIYRHESLYDAIELDDKLVSIYDTHKNRRIIYNDLPFDDKIQRIIAHIADFLHIPNVIRKPLKFLIQVQDTETEKELGNNDIIAIVHNIEKCLLKEKDAVSIQIMSVTKTFINLSSEKKQNVETFVRETISLKIDKNENLEQLVQQDMASTVDKNYMLVESSEEFGQKMHKSVQLSKQRYDEYKKFNSNDQLEQIQSVQLSFYYRGTYVKLKIFKQLKNAQNVMVLEVYRAADKKCVDSDGNLIIDLPECIVIGKNVTNDMEHTGYAIASGQNEYVFSNNAH